MSYTPWYEEGAWLVVCDRCGFYFKSDELRSEWTGLKVCSECWDYRHPQDFVRSMPDKQAPPWQRPEQTDTYLVDDSNARDYLSIANIGDGVGDPSKNNIATYSVVSGYIDADYVVPGYVDYGITVPTITYNKPF